MLAEELSAIAKGRYCCAGCLNTAPPLQGGKCTGLPSYGMQKVKGTPGDLSLFVCNNCYKKTSYMEKSVMMLLQPDDFRSFRGKPNADATAYIQFLEERLTLERGKRLRTDSSNDVVIDLADFSDARFFEEAYRPDPVLLPETSGEQLLTVIPPDTTKEEEDLDDDAVYLRVFLRDIRKTVDDATREETTRRLQTKSPHVWRLLCLRKKNAIKIFSLLRWNAELKEAYDVHCASLEMARKDGDWERVNPPEPKYLPLPDFVQDIIRRFPSK